MHVRRRPSRVGLTAATGTTMTPRFRPQHVSMRACTRPRFCLLVCLVCLLFLTCAVVRNVTTSTSSILSRASYVPYITARRVVVIVPTTRHYLHLLPNLQCTVAYHTNRYALVVALDAATARFARKRKYPVLGPLPFMTWAEGRVDGNDPHHFHSRQFRTITKFKLSAVLYILSRKYDVLLTDVDVVWCDNVVSLLAEQIQSNYNNDVLIQSDSCRYNAKWTRLNTGFYYAKSTPDVIRLFQATLHTAMDPKYAHFDDQKAFIHTACNGSKISWDVVGKNIDICRWRNKVYVKALPIDKFVNGAVFWNKTRTYNLDKGVLRGMCERKEVKMWHNNWSSAEDKIERFARHDMWFVDNKTNRCAFKSVRP